MRAQGELRCRDATSHPSLPSRPIEGGANWIHLRVVALESGGRSSAARRRAVGHPGSHSGRAPLQAVPGEANASPGAGG